MKKNQIRFEKENPNPNPNTEKRVEGKRPIWILFPVITTTNVC
jgi:hypothetical protein